LPRRINKRTVQEALSEHKWISDNRGALTVGMIVDYLHLWNILCEVALHPGVRDSHLWRFVTSGKFSVKSAYEGFFVGSVEFEPLKGVWKTWAPVKCQFFGVAGGP
jgi:hypothetical protein